MSSDWFQDVMDFHAATGLPIGTTPASPSNDVRALRNDLENEEHRELMEAHFAGDLPALADACADLIYVILGRCVSYGIDLRRVWDEVHRSNMAKVGGPIREDGKRLKPPGWTPPDVGGVLSSQKPLTTS